MVSAKDSEYNVQTHSNPISGKDHQLHFTGEETEALSGMRVTELGVGLTLKPPDLIAILKVCTAGQRPHYYQKIG